MPYGVTSNPRSEDFFKSIDLTLESLRDYGFDYRSMDLGNDVMRYAITGPVETDKPLYLDLAQGQDLGGREGGQRAVDLVYGTNTRRPFGRTEITSSRGMPQYSDVLSTFRNYVAGSFGPSELYGGDPNTIFNELIAFGNVGQKAPYGAGNVAGGVPMYGKLHGQAFARDISRQVGVGLESEQSRQSAWEAINQQVKSAGTGTYWSELGAHLPYSESNRGEQFGSNFMALRPIGEIMNLGGQPGTFDYNIMGLGEKDVSAVAKRFQLAEGVRERASLFRRGVSGGIERAMPGPALGGNTPFGQMPFEQQSGYRKASMLYPGETELRDLVVNPGSLIQKESPFPGGLEVINSALKGFYSGGYDTQKPYELNVPNLRDLPKTKFDFGIFKEKTNKQGVTTYTKQRDLKGAFLEAGRTAVIGTYTTPDEVIHPLRMTAGSSDLLFPDNPILNLPATENLLTGRGAMMAGLSNMERFQLERDKQPIPEFRRTNEPGQGQQSLQQQVQNVFPGEVRTRGQDIPNIILPVSKVAALSYKSNAVKGVSFEPSDVDVIRKQQAAVQAGDAQGIINSVTGDVKIGTGRTMGTFMAWNPYTQEKALELLPGELGQKMPAVLRREYEAATRENRVPDSGIVGAQFAELSGHKEWGQNYGFRQMISEMRMQMLDPSRREYSMKTFGEGVFKEEEVPFVGVGSFQMQDKAIMERQIMQGIMEGPENRGTNITEEQARTRMNQIFKFTPLYTGPSGRLQEEGTTPTEYGVTSEISPKTYYNRQRKLAKPLMDMGFSKKEVRAMGEVEMGAVPVTNDKGRTTGYQVEETVAASELNRYLSRNKSNVVSYTPTKTAPLEQTAWLFSQRQAAAYGTLATGITPEYRSGNITANLMDRLAVSAVAGEDAAFELGLNPSQSPTDSRLLSPSDRAWREATEMYRYNRDPEAKPPFETTTITEQTARNALAVLESGKMDYKAAEKALGGGQGLLWNPRTNRYAIRPSSAEVMGEWEFGNEEETGKNIAFVTRKYKNYLTDFLSDATPETSRRMDRYEEHISQIIESRAGTVMKSMMGTVTPGVGGRYNYASGVSINQALVQSDVLNQTIAARAKGEGMTVTSALTKRWERNALRNGVSLASMAIRDPGVSTMAAMLLEPITPERLLQTKGISAPVGSRIKNGRLVPGSVESTGWVAGMNAAVNIGVGDYDADPMKIFSPFIKFDAKGNIVPLSNFQVPSSEQSLNLQELALRGMFGGASAPGGSKNALAEQYRRMAWGAGNMKSQIPGMDRGIQSYTREQLLKITGSKIGEAGLFNLGAMGKSYNTMRSLMSGMSAVSLPEQEINTGVNALVKNYQHYLDLEEKEGEYSAVENMLGTAVFTRDKGDNSLGAAWMVGNDEWRSIQAEKNASFEQQLGRGFIGAISADIKTGRTMPEAAASVLSQPGVISSSEIMERMSKRPGQETEVLAELGWNKDWQFSKTGAGQSTIERLTTNLEGASWKEGRKEKIINVEGKAVHEATNKLMNEDVTMGWGGNMMTPREIYESDPTTVTRNLLQGARRKGGPILPTASAHLAEVARRMKAAGQTVPRQLEDTIMHTGGYAALAAQERQDVFLEPPAQGTRGNFTWMGPAEGNVATEALSKESRTGIFFNKGRGEAVSQDNSFTVGSKAYVNPGGKIPEDLWNEIKTNSRNRDWNYTNAMEAINANERSVASGGMAEWNPETPTNRGGFFAFDFETSRIGTPSEQVPGIQTYSIGNEGKVVAPLSMSIQEAQYTDQGFVGTGDRKDYLIRPQQTSGRPATLKQIGQMLGQTTEKGQTIGELTGLSVDAFRKPQDYGFAGVMSPEQAGMMSSQMMQNQPSPVAMAYNGRGFDFPLMSGLLSAAKQPTLEERGALAFDPLDVAKRTMPGKHNLAAVAKNVGLAVDPAQLHHAGGDVDLMLQAAGPLVKKAQAAYATRNMVETQPDARRYTVTASNLPKLTRTPTERRAMGISKTWEAGAFNRLRAENTMLAEGKTQAEIDAQFPIDPAMAQKGKEFQDFANVEAVRTHGLSNTITDLPRERAPVIPLENVMTQGELSFLPQGTAMSMHMTPDIMGLTPDKQAMTLEAKGGPSQRKTGQLQGFEYNFMLSRLAGWDPVQGKSWGGGGKEFFNPVMEQLLTYGNKDFANKTPEEQAQIVEDYYQSYSTGGATARYHEGAQAQIGAPFTNVEDFAIGSKGTGILSNQKAYGLMMGNLANAAADLTGNPMAGKLEQVGAHTRFSPSAVRGPVIATTRTGTPITQQRYPALKVTNRGPQPPSNQPPVGGRTEALPPGEEPLIPLYDAERNRTGFISTRDTAGNPAFGGLGQGGGQGGGYSPDFFKPFIEAQEALGLDVGELKEQIAGGLSINFSGGNPQKTHRQVQQVEAGIAAVGYSQGQKRFGGFQAKYLSQIGRVLGLPQEEIARRPDMWAGLNAEAWQSKPAEMAEFMQGPQGRVALEMEKQNKLIQGGATFAQRGAVLGEMGIESAPYLAQLRAMAKGKQSGDELAGGLDLATMATSLARNAGVVGKNAFEPTLGEIDGLTEKFKTLKEAMVNTQKTVEEYGETHQKSIQAIREEQKAEIGVYRESRGIKLRAVRQRISDYEAMQPEEKAEDLQGYEEAVMQETALQKQETASKIQEQNIAKAEQTAAKPGATMRQISQATRSLIGGFGLFYMGTLAKMGLGALQEGYPEGQAIAEATSQQAQTAFGPGQVSPFVSPEQIRKQALARSGGGVYAAMRTLTAGTPGMTSDLSGGALTGIGAMGLAMHIGTSMERMGGVAGVFGQGLYESAAGIGIGIGAVMPAVIQAGYAINREQSILQAAATEAGGGNFGQIGAAWKLAGPTVRDWLEGKSSITEGSQFEQQQLVAQMKFITGQKENQTDLDKRWEKALEMERQGNPTQANLLRAQGIPKPEYKKVPGTPDEIAKLAQVFATTNIPGIQNLPEELKSQLAIQGMRAGFQGGDLQSYVQGVGQATAAGLPVQQLAQQTLALQGKIAPDVRQTATMEAMYGNAPFGSVSGGMGGLRRYESLPYYSPQRQREIAAGQQLMMQTPGILEQTYGRTAPQIDQMAEQYFQIAGGPRQEAFLTRANVLQQAVDAGVAGARPMSQTEMQHYYATQGTMTNQQRFEGQTLNLGTARVIAATTAWNALGVGYDVAGERAAMAATPAGDILQQRGQAITRQALQYGQPAPVGGFMAAALRDTSGQLMAFGERVLGGSPIAITDMAMKMQNAGNIGGAQQWSDRFAMDTGLNGQQTGMAWGTTGLAKGGYTATSMANRIWGNLGVGEGGKLSGWREAATTGITLPNGQKVGGQWGIQAYMQQEGYKQQQTQTGIQMAQIALQEKYQPMFWNIEDRQRTLADTQAQWGFQIQERQAGMQRSQFQEQSALQRTQMLTGRQWAREDWGYQDQQRAQSWGWKQQDFQEQARFMTGRDRRLAERGMERETIMYGQQGDEIERQRSRQKQQWQWEDESFAQKQKHFNESQKLQEEDRNRQKEFYEEGKKLRDEQVVLQRAMWREQIALQKQSIAASAEYAKNMNEANLALMSFSQEEQKQAGRQRLASENMTTLWNNLMEGLDWVVAHVSSEAIQAAVLGGGTLGRLPGQNPGAGQNGNPGDPTPTAIGGPAGMGRSNIVGEAGTEIVRSSGALSVIPNNELRAMMYETQSKDVWSNSFASQSSPVSGGNQNVTVVINIGNERLGKYVVKAIEQELEA